MSDDKQPKAKSAEELAAERRRAAADRIVSDGPVLVLEPADENKGQAED